MSEDRGQEKTEEATPKRLRDARKKGQVAKSRDLNTIVILIGACVLLAFLKGDMGQELRTMFQTTFEAAVRNDITTELLFKAGQATFFSYVKTIGPFLIGIVVIALTVAFLQIGPIFSAEPLKPQIKRLNAIENLKNMFKVTTLVELFKNIAKLSLIFYLAYLVIADNLTAVVFTVTSTPEKSMQVASHVLVSFLSKVFVVFIVIAIIDLMVQRWHYKKQMKMTKEEVKREYKQDEGDPLIKSARRQMHREFAMSDTKQQVKTSDVVVTNPTHVAVALRYDDKEMMAPEITAKGQRLFAEAIREYAKEFNIPIISNPPLAWTLIEFDIGDEIPENLYAAIAELLVYVYNLKKAKG